MVKIPTLTNQTRLDASPEPMVNPVANRTGEIMGKGIQQVGTVMHRVQQRQQMVQNINLSRQFNAELVYQADNKAFGLSGRFGFSKNQDHIEVDKIQPYFFFDIEFTL